MNDDIDRAEIDQLVDDLAQRRAPKPVLPPVFASIGPDESDRLAAAPEPAPAPDARPAGPGRWTTARVLMPSTRTTRKRAFALGSLAAAIGPRAWPRLAHLPQLVLPEMSEAQLAVFTARLFVALGLVLSAAMPYWPYANGSSWGLLLYLSALLLDMVTGVWGAKLTWDRRLGAAHALSLCVVFWALTLVAAEVLPRVGYAEIQKPWF